MEAFITFLILVAVVGVLVWVEHRDRTTQHKRDEVIRQLRKADSAVQREFLTTKRRMNDAAGQSWRNLFE